MVMYTRKLALPKKSFFLFGPRGTGKTTWLKANLKNAKWFNLLSNMEHLRLMRDPSLLRKEVEALKKGSWIVVDEVQRLPALLNEIHSLIFDYGSDYRFALTGSSARKLKREQANLLAGRAINRSFFPLTGAELEYQFSLESLLMYGSLPSVRMDAKDADACIDFLDAYVANYLKEEIKQEALVKNLESFVRFIEVAALANAQVTNIAGVARDAAVARPTVQGYFDTLVDTLIGFWLPAWRSKAKIKEVQHPKFYFFDCGVARACAGRVREPLDSAERGHLLETLVLHELRAYIGASNCGGQLSYWRTPSGSEIDFIWTRASHAIGIEVKASNQWRSEYSKALREMLELGKVKRAFGVYTGDKILKDGAIRILPVENFMRELNDGAVLR